MKLASLLVAAAAAAAALTTTTAQEATAAPAGSNSSSTLGSGVGSGSGGQKPFKTIAPSTGTPSDPAGPSPLDSLKATPSKDSYHMKPIRVVHARVQGDSPELVKGRFVSSYGKGDLNAGYLMAMDTVNTASVEGALMYVQAEGINVRTRSTENRCERKYKMRNIVFYEIVIAQTNETIAQFRDKWNTPEYGPMVPMDGGRCTPKDKDGKVMPVECFQFNGDNGHPNLGPFIGAGIKADDARAPYPDNYWFSFPSTCPTKGWVGENKKTDECRSNTRKGLCPLGQAPDGVTCTFAYDILGWVTIDDVVGITSIVNEKTGKPYGNFTLWCEADPKHIEFEGDGSAGGASKNLPFWDKPTDPKANAKRAEKVLEIYDDIIAGKFASTMIDAKDMKAFKPLPSPEDLSKKNPPCYESVPSCATGCKRVGYSQLCKPCTPGEDGCKVAPSGFSFPKLAKAPTKLSDDQLTSGSNLMDLMNPEGARKSASSVHTVASAVALVAAVACVIA